jgi:hypothetical protein
MMSPTLHRQNLAQTHRRGRQFRADFNFGVFQLLAQHDDPASVGGQLVALHGAVEQVTNRLEHRIRKADVHIGAGATEFQREGRRHDDFGRRRNIRELGIHLRAEIFESQVVDRLPRSRVFSEYDLEQSLDDALFCRRKVAAFNTGVEATVAAEHVVHDQKYQTWVEDEQCRAAQWLARRPDSGSSGPPGCG